MLTGTAASTSTWQLRRVLSDCGYIMTSVPTKVKVLSSPEFMLRMESTIQNGNSSLFLSWWLHSSHLKVNLICVEATIQIVP